MKALMAPLRELAEFEEMDSQLKKHRESISLSGCMDSQKLHMIHGLGADYRERIIITYDEQRAREIREDYRIYDRNAVFYPAKDLMFYQADIHGNELVQERMKCIRRRMEGKKLTLVTTIDALLAPMVPADVFRESVLEVEKGGTISQREFASRLVAMGYLRNYQVEAPGEFSIRGDIIDVFDLTEENPYRISLWGDEVEELKSFDILSQRSIEELRSVSIFPSSELILSEDRLKNGFVKIKQSAKKRCEELRKRFETESAHRLEQTILELEQQALELAGEVNLESYISFFYEKTGSFLEFFAGENTCLFLDEPVHLAECVDWVEQEFSDSMEHRLAGGYLLSEQTKVLKSTKELKREIETMRYATVSALERRGALVQGRHHYDIEARSQTTYNNSFEALVKDLEKYKKNGFRVLLMSASHSKAIRMAKELQERGITAFYTENPTREIQAGETMVSCGRIRKGFEYPMLKFIVISEEDIFGNREKRKRRSKKYEGTKIRGFADLKVGDYVVHENHGLGIYQGIEKVEVNHVVKDYVKIEYRDGGNLYVLATGLDAIQKYASADAKKPKLNKLGSQEWAKTKTKVRGAVDEVAKDLVNLYAVRQQKNGHAFEKDTVWQREFEELFPFEATEDQLMAIADTKADMESHRIMDRLICGDVGFGKTEVAIRAAFKAVQENKQVVFLVPTTILAQQHYNTLVQRMKDFPVTIGLLCRFRTPAQQKKTLAELKKGQVDILVGTHRVLSKDVEFKDLGLLVVDEEQRFGVTHKEKIKKLKENIDVLSLSATPIPRTLHMSLVGIRDMSVLEEAPNDRMPIQTFVCEYNEELVREAITRELSRQGQVYYVYNRVNNIADVRDRIQQLVPDAVVAYAHGQMKEHELEQIMMDFIDGNIDVLVSTTIVETGMDISNVNTMIIHDADQMGLSQLYQLRGRVGRSSRSAYAFLLYKRDKLLKEVAEKRLQAIREFTDLGSGFKIAMRDLEIRGAGNLLGRMQHGHMEAVGYDLYCKMLNDAVSGLKGIPIEEAFETTVDLDVDAFIPPSYILNEMQKLDIYKRIAAIEGPAESEDMKAELRDRFGEVPKSVENLLQIALLRERAHKIFITELRGKDGEIKILMKPDAQINVGGIPDVLTHFGKKIEFRSKGVPFFLYRYRKPALVEQEAENLLQTTEEILRVMEENLLQQVLV